MIRHVERQIPGIGAIVANARARRNGGEAPTRGQIINAANFTALPVEQRYGDHYLGQLSPLVTGEGELALLSSPLPGHMEFLGKLGFPGKVFAMPHMQHSGDLYDADPLTTLTRLLPEGGTLHNGDTAHRYALNPVFVTPEVVRRGRQVGIETLDIPDSTQTNDKARLRDHAREFGIRMFDGHVYSGEITEDMTAAILERFESYPKGVWIKLGQGSGGDSVFHVDQLTEDSLRQTLQYARKNHIASVGGNADSWPESHIAPVTDRLVIEADARNVARNQEIVSLGSNLVVDGTMVGAFEQITDNGAFVGSRTVRLTPAQEELLTRQVVAATNYMESIGFPYPFGMDYIFYENQQGVLQIGILEINARLPISGYAWWTAQRLGVEGFYNSNVTLPAPVSDFSQVEEMLTLPSGENLLFDSRRGWGIVPAAFRTIPGTSSPHAKFFLMGSDEEQGFIRDRMLENGIRLGVL